MPALPSTGRPRSAPRRYPGPGLRITLRCGRTRGWLDAERGTAVGRGPSPAVRSQVRGMSPLDAPGFRRSCASHGPQRGKPLPSPSFPSATGAIGSSPASWDRRSEMAAAASHFALPGAAGFGDASRCPGTRPVHRPASHGRCVEESRLGQGPRRRCRAEMLTECMSFLDALGEEQLADPGGRWLERTRGAGLPPGVSGRSGPCRRSNPRIVRLTARNGSIVPGVHSAPAPWPSLALRSAAGGREACSIRQAAGFLVVPGLGAASTSRPFCSIPTSRRGPHREEIEVLRSLSRSRRSRRCSKTRVALCAGCASIREGVLAAWQPAVMGGMRTVPLRPW